MGREDCGCWAEGGQWDTDPTGLLRYHPSRRFVIAQILFFCRFFKAEVWLMSLHLDF